MDFQLIKSWIDSIFSHIVDRARLTNEIETRMICLLLYLPSTVIAQNAYCSWDIYLQSSYNHRSVILPVLLQLSAFDWLMITRAFFHWEYLLLIKVQEVEQRDNTYVRHCSIFCFAISHLQLLISQSVLQIFSLAERKDPFSFCLHFR